MKGALSPRDVRILALDDGKRTPKEIAFEIGCPLNAVYEARCRAKLGAPPGFKPRAPTRAPEAVALVQAAMAAGETRKDAIQIAAVKMGIKTSSVRNCLSTMMFCTVQAARETVRIKCATCPLTLFDAEELARGTCNDCIPPIEMFASNRHDADTCVARLPVGRAGGS